MTDPTRDELFDTLASLLEIYPQFRASQALCVFAGAAVWDAGDDSLLAGARRYHAALVARGIGTDGVWRGDPASDAATRAGLLAALADLARRHPHRTLGRLVGDLADRAGSNVWDVEDDQLLAAARTHHPAEAARAAGKPAAHLPHFRAPASL